MLTQNKGAFDGASPKLTFIFGFVTGLALTSLVSVLLMFNVMGSGGLNTAKKDGGTKDAEAPTQDDEPLEMVVPEVTENDHILGNPDADITIILFDDYECPFCSRHHPTIESISEAYGEDVRIVYKHFPLNSMHPQATPSAEASECVAALSGNDAFWEFSAEMFENQQSLGDDFYAETAEKVGVNKAEFEECYSEGKYSDVVAKHYSEGIKAGVTGTPGNIIIDQDGNAVPVSGAVPYEQFQSILDSLLGS